VNIVECLSDPRLLGGLPQFRDLSSWRSWLVFLRATYGLPMSDDDRDAFRQFTGRTAPRPGGYPEAAAIVGVQSGKSQIAGAMAAFAAITGRDGTHALLLAQDQRSALRRCCATPGSRSSPCRCSLRKLRAMLPIRWNCAMASRCLHTPASPRAFASPSGAGSRRRTRVLRHDGCRPLTKRCFVPPGTSSDDGGKLVVLSSPYAAAGALYDLHRRHYGRDDSPVLVWQRPRPR